MHLVHLQVREHLREAVRAKRFDRRGLYIALEHERMHQETLSYMQAQQRRKAFESTLGAGTVQPAMANGMTAMGATGSDLCRKGVSKPRIHDSHDGRSEAESNGHGAFGGKPSGLVANGRLLNGHGKHDGEHHFLDLVLCPAGKAVLGVNTDQHSSGFVWDNEGPQQVGSVNIFYCKNSMDALWSMTAL